MTDIWNRRADALYALLLNRANALVLFFTTDADWHRIRGAIQDHSISTRKAGELDAARAVLVAMLARRAGGSECHPSPNDFWEVLAMDLYAAVAKDVDNLVAFYLDGASGDALSALLAGSDLAALPPNEIAAIRAVLAARLDRSWDPGEFVATAEAHS